MAKKSARREARAAREGKGPAQSVKQDKAAKAKKTSEKAGPQGVTGKVTELKQFFDESLVEIKKVTWPSRKETVSTSIAVVVLVFVMSLFLGVVDLGLTKLVELILS